MKTSQRGTALVIVLGVILVVTMLSAIVISFMLSQSRLTKHQIDHTKARYAAQSAVNYALEMMRLGCWTAGQNYTICNTAAAGCSEPNVTDTDFPWRANISIGSQGSCISGTTCINATVNYTYQP